MIHYIFNISITLLIKYIALYSFVSNFETPFYKPVKPFIQMFMAIFLCYMQSTKNTDFTMK